MALIPSVDKGIEELSPIIDDVDNKISSVSESLQPLLDCPVADMAAKVGVLQRAKIDLISLYAVNSMFWVYLKTLGINPTTHGLSKELNRVKTYLGRMKEAEDRKLAPRLNKDVTKRVMRNALWSAAHRQRLDSYTVEATSSSASAKAAVPESSTEVGVVSKKPKISKKSTKDPKKAALLKKKKKKKLAENKD
ncbi:nuclear nucleic acid-binding protein C1D-like [Watersipora subatra]|uniref:nuclear nucleic acid-binding protein C1D-like n=1 Tax=Watersipora subatra TaxID=2589382 RepID=UPI00355BF286